MFSYSIFLIYEFLKKILKIICTLKFRLFPIVTLQFFIIFKIWYFSNFLSFLN